MKIIIMIMNTINDDDYDDTADAGIDNYGGS